MIKGQLSMGEKYSNFKKTHGPPHYSYNARFDALEHNEYLQRRHIPLSEVRMFEPQVRVAHTEEHHH